jgi:hypothetical protein
MMGMNWNRLDEIAKKATEYAMTLNQANNVKANDEQFALAA